MVKQRHEPGPPMDLANMRRQGVHDVLFTQEELGVVWDCFRKLREAGCVHDIFTARNAVHVPCGSPVCEGNVVAVDVHTRGVRMLTLIIALWIPDCRYTLIQPLSDLLGFLEIVRRQHL